MMWLERFRLIWLMMHAWVVDLPLPAGPVISTMSLVRPASSITWGGIRMACQSGMP